METFDNSVTVDLLIGLNLFSTALKEASKSNITNVSQ